MVELLIRFYDVAVIQQQQKTDVLLPKRFRLAGMKYFTHLLIIALQYKCATQPMPGLHAAARPIIIHKPL